MWCYALALTLLAASAGGALPTLPDDDQVVYPEEQAIYPVDVQLTSKPLQLTVREGDDVRLPCQWEGDAQGVVVLWKKMPSMLLFAGQLKMYTEDRITLGPNDSPNELVIKNVKPEDDGIYMCQVSLFPNPLELRHTVTVERPAKLHPMDSDHFEVREGDSFELVCRADGVPEPTVSWSKVLVEDSEGPYFDNGDLLATTSVPEGDDLAFLQEDSSRGVAFTIDSVEPRHTGTYTCTAQNGIGEPDVLTTRLEVIHAPHIAVEHDVVRTARGLTAEMVCKVFANPRAKEVVWQRNGLNVSGDSRYERTVTRRFFSLKIRNVKDDDLGNYTCLAINKLGRSENHITLTGLPGDLELRLEQPVRGEDGRHSSRLSWDLISFAPLQKTVVSLRQLEPAGPGPLEVGLPGQPSRSVAKSGEHQLTDLLENTTYEVRVEAQNQYGWTPPASLFFSIADGELTTMQEPPRLAETKSDASSIRRFKMIPIMLIVSLSSFF